MALRSVNGKGTRTTSPWLKLVVDGILGVVPELERRLGRFEPSDIVRLNFQMCRQIVKEQYLVAHIQVLDCLADFLNRAHEKNLTQIFPMRSAENSGKREKVDLKIKKEELGIKKRRKGRRILESKKEEGKIKNRGKEKDFEDFLR
jgi:hypothetical protein